MRPVTAPSFLVESRRSGLPVFVIRENRENRINRGNRSPEKTEETDSTEGTEKSTYAIMQPSGGFRNKGGQRVEDSAVGAWPDDGPRAERPCLSRDRCGRPAPPVDTP